MLVQQGRALKDCSPRLLHRDSYIAVGLVTLWPMLTSLWSIAPKYSLHTPLKIGIFLLLLLVGLVAANLPRTQTSTKSAYYLGVGVLLATFCLVLEMLPSGGLLLQAAQSVGITAEEYYNKDINRGLSALALLVWPAVIGMAIHGRRKLAFLLPLLVVLPILSLHSLAAKTGILSGIAVFYGMYQYPTLFKRLLPIMLPLAFLLAPIAFYLLEPLLHLPSIYNIIPESSQHRIAIWHFAMEKWSMNPLLGWGADTSRVIPGGDVMIRPNWASMPMHPHNIPIQILLEQGVVGLTLASAALFLFIRRAFAFAGENLMASAAVAAAITSFIVIGFWGFSMWQSWWINSAIITTLLIGFCLRAEKA